MPRLLRLVVFSLSLAAVGLAIAAALSPGVAGAAWRWPVRGEVVGEFAYSPSAPFAAGARRGIDIAARPGAAVHAACDGWVTFAGRLPVHRTVAPSRTPERELAWGVTVRCGRLAATHVDLARILVRRGARVAAGATLGTAGPAGVVRLGARVVARRFGYLDPLALLGAEPGPTGGPGPIGAAPRDGRPRRAPAPIRPRPVMAPARPRPAAAPLRPRPVSRPIARADREPPAHVDRRSFPAAGWAGLALLAAGLPLGRLMRSRRRRSARLARTDRTTCRYSRQDPIGSDRVHA